MEKRQAERARRNGGRQADARDRALMALITCTRYNTEGVAKEGSYEGSGMCWEREAREQERDTQTIKHTHTHTPGIPGAKQPTKETGGDTRLQRRLHRGGSEE